MDKVYINKIVDAWVVNCSAQEGTNQYRESFWSVSKVIDWQLEGLYENLWQFILLVYKRNISKEILADLAAGPLEDLLVDRGSDYIEQIEQLSRKDKKFNWLLGGVWRSSISEDIWQRVEATRKEVW